MDERAEMAVLDQFHADDRLVDSRLTVVDSVYSDVINRLTNAQTRAGGGRNSILTPEQRTRSPASCAAPRAPSSRRSTPATAACTSSRAASRRPPPYTSGPPISAYQGDASVQYVDIDRGRAVQVTFDARGHPPGERRRPT